MVDVEILRSAVCYLVPSALEGAFGSRHEWQVVRRVLARAPSASQPRTAWAAPGRWSIESARTEAGLCGMAYLVQVDTHGAQRGRIALAESAAPDQVSERGTGAAQGDAEVDEHGAGIGVGL